MLDQIISEQKIKAQGVVAFYPANAQSDDVVLYSDASRNKPMQKLHFLRQQNKKAANLPNFCLADYIAPATTGIADYIGMFAVTAGEGMEQLVAYYKAQQDDYNEIMVKALCDRLAEAFAECLHAMVRKDLWGYAHHESLPMQDIIDEKYEGIRPAPGYPACPDHTEKTTLFDLMNATEATGITLTESLAMYPASSVSGYYFSHPASTYFGLGKIDKDQVMDYAQRKGLPLTEVETWLGQSLGY
jgi:5-methyltetrahydrofolate--homocysteine methyltransferase